MNFGFCFLTVAVLRPAESLSTSPNTGRKYRLHLQPHSLTPVYTVSASATCALYQWQLSPRCYIPWQSLSWSPFDMPDGRMKLEKAEVVGG